MNLTDESCRKFGEALAEGVGSILGRASTGSWLTMDQYRSGHVQITEALHGGPSAASYFAKQAEAISPAITGVQVTPVSLGNPATYSIGISFDAKKAEAMYSDGKDGFVSLEKDGKKYMVGGDGKAVEVEDPDKYIDNLNKTTGSRYQKQSEGAEDILASLQALVDEANVALDGTGVEVSLGNGKISLNGDAALIKPTQKALPDPLFGLEDLEGGYNNSTGAVEVIIPAFTDERDVANLEDFLYKAVNIILDIIEKGDYTEEDEWKRLVRDARADSAYASRYSYMGESFVVGDKAESAKLVKSLMAVNFDEAKKAAKALMGEKIAEAVLKPEDKNL